MVMIAPSAAQLALCANRRVGHTWNQPDNQHWEQAEPVKIGRRTIDRVRCVSTCDRCGSERIEPFLLDRRRCLAERDTMWYRPSKDYTKRDRLSTDELNWKRIPTRLLKVI